MDFLFLFVAFVEAIADVAHWILGSSALNGMSSYFINGLIHSSMMTNLTTVSMLANFLALHKYGPGKTKTKLKEHYDFIIVGAGTAGSALATRLSEIDDFNVLLLEAGGDPPILSEIPFIGIFLLGSQFDWNYKTVPQKHAGAGLNNRQFPYRMGKTLGGTSVLNDMLMVRGNRKNYDDWAKGGATGWSYKEVLHYFKKLEDFQEHDFGGKKTDYRYHGVGGPITAIQPHYRPKLREAVLEAAGTLNYSIVDANGRNQLGFFPVTAAIRNGRRCSIAKAYLSTTDDRMNLDILKNAFVTKVIINGSKAIGVEFIDKHGEKHTVLANKEVILSAGTAHTAQLLLLSGIGPRKELVKHKIPVVADLPVGENFQDHMLTIQGYQMSKEIPSVASNLLTGYPEYAMHGSGMYASPAMVSVLAFLSKNQNTTGFKVKKSLPDYQLYFMDGITSRLKGLMNINNEVFRAVYEPHSFESTTFCFSQLTNTRSRGRITLESADPRVPPIIDPNFLGDEDDVTDILEGMKKCNEVAKTRPMQEIGMKLWQSKIPQCSNYDDVESDEYLRCFIRTLALPSWHPVGTAKMGAVNDPTTVVDPQLRVKGIKGLRVADASVMPQIISGNTYLPTVMIGEKAADLIKDTHLQLPELKE